MRFLSLIALTIGSYLCAPVSVAHAKDLSGELKIGYVDMARAINDVEDGKSAKAKLKTEFEKKQQKLDKLQNELKTKKEEFEKQAGMLKAEARQTKQDELQRDFVEAQKYYMQVQQELMENEKRVTQEIGDKLRTIIAKVGDREGHMVILNIGDTVLYSKRHMDITDQIIRDYNNQYGKK